MITAPQIKGARAMLGLSQRELAELASVGLATVQRIELTAEIRGAAETIWKIQKALEAAGVEFIPGDEQRGPGVRLKEPAKAKPKRGRRKPA
jgi:transcriptional regulator with XRE-family HTH domain